VDFIPNRFLKTEDLSTFEYSFLKNDIENYYVKRWRGTPHPWGSKYPDTVITHWSREWEYPWAVINAEITRNYTTILDCGCGGSPLLPYITEKTGCFSTGIDLTYGDRFKEIERYDTPLADLKNFYTDPSTLVPNFKVVKGSIANIPAVPEFFDRVFCISVIEHIESEDIAKKCVSEMVRVLKPGGRLLITMDHTQHKNHIKPWCLGQFQKIIDWSGLKLFGRSDFSVPEDEEIHGLYHVVGFVLQK
jgi:SAM-dependent methyltransferase